MTDHDCPKNYEKFVNLDKCNQTIEELHKKLDPIDEKDETRARSDGESLIEQFRRLIDPYQEQPELLEPYLNELIEALIKGLHDSNISSIRYHTIFKFLYQLIKVTGFKSISKKFPHETSNLPLLIELLSKEDINDKYDWQTRFVLTVWLSIVILTPFDLSKFDSDSSEKSISERIYSILTRNLSLHDSCQHVTAYCLAKFFSRPDIMRQEGTKYIDSFISLSMEELKNVKYGFAVGSTDDVQLIGYLRTLCYMLKFLPRAEMKTANRCKEMLNVLVKLNVDKINRELINHLIIKLIQRTGLALLPQRLATWRYKRGSRILGQIIGHKDDDSDGDNSAIKQANASKLELAATDEASSNCEDVEAIEYLESILSVLFVAAQNGQTRIRWSASKGIARISSRLDREKASEVIDMVLQNFFHSTSSEFAWHGGCLALAEMSRNGLILEEKLQQVMNIINQAIIYDRIKGSFAVGSHVREAACYVCWAMARTYEDHLLAPHIPTISIKLLCTMLFDRELQCRRAASATFQELVGRQGTFNEEGISILNNVDYQNVGQRQLTYSHLASQIAGYGSRYSQPFVEHLLEKKVGHWDIQIRRLASDSLAGLMLHSNHEFISSKVIPPLRAMSEQNLDNNSKHGAILSLAKVVSSLVPLQYNFDKNLITFMGDLVRKCEKQLKSKQQAPNFIEAIGLVISSCDAASFEFPVQKRHENIEADGEVVEDVSDVVKQWESIVLTALDNDNKQLREVGAEALLTLYKTYYKNNKSRQDKLLTILNRSLASMNESTRCGSLKALSKLSRVPCTYVKDTTIRLDADTPEVILMSITSYISKATHEKTNDLIFAQAKAESCEALVNFIYSLEGRDRLYSVLNLIKAGYDALLEKSEDYTMDKRGDIGVTIRRAAIKALQDLTLHLLAVNLTSLFESNLITRMMKKILQQCVSYNDSARELASVAFYKLVSSDLSGDLIPHKSIILDLLDKYNVSDDFNWRDDGTPVFVSLLAKPEYSQDLWFGLLSSVGQVSEICAKQFRESLSNYLKELIEKCESNEPEVRKELDYIFESLLDCLSGIDSIAWDRFLSSGLNVIDYLLTQGLMGQTSDNYRERLVDFCWRARHPGGGGQTKGAKSDPKRLMSIARVLSSMLQFTGKVQATCLGYCLQLLASGYARVRAYTAEQLYLTLMTYEEAFEGMDPDEFKQLEAKIKAVMNSEPAQVSV